MKRSGANLARYRVSCRKVIDRADNRCEVMIGGGRCGKYIVEPKWINFAHTDSRNGQTDEWSLDPENIIFTCAEHHIDEHTQGEKIERCNYEEITYVPE